MAEGRLQKSSNPCILSTISKHFPRTELQECKKKKRRRKEKKKKKKKEKPNNWINMDWKDNDQKYHFLENKFFFKEVPRQEFSSGLAAFIPI